MGDNMDCIFCKIINGDVPSYTLFEDDMVKVFLDVNPMYNGHTLIIPKKHYKDLDDIDLETLSHILMIAKKIKKELEEKLNCDGVILTQNNGNVQEVKHYHLHLIPSYKETQNIVDIEEIYKKIKN